MTRPELDAAGGFPAIRYTLARSSRRPLAMLRALRSSNACKTCAVGMGGEAGGMVNEAGHFPEVCKKSVQAQAADLADGIDEEFFRHTDIARLESLTSRDADRLGRLVFPIALFPGERHFRRIEWSEALATAGDALRATTPERTFFYMSGRSSNEAAFLTQLIARAFGTGNIHNCSFYCHNASSVALTSVYGTGTSSVDLEDLAQADCAVVIGANPASNHPRLITSLITLRERGGVVVSVNPIAELGLQRFRLPSQARSLLSGSQVSDLILQPRVGGDIPLLIGLLKALIARSGVDRSFIDERTNGWDELSDQIAGFSWSALEAASGVPRAELERCADLLAAAPRGIVMWAMGLTHHAHGTDNVLALANLALARGWLGRPGAGMLPIRGHSNVQGVGSMGVSPAMKDTFAEALSRRYGIATPTQPGQDTYASMLAAEAGNIDAAVLLGGNLWASNPDSAWATRALQTIPLTFSVTTGLNPGHFRGRGQTAIIVPALARDEEAQTTTQESMFNYVRFSAGGRPHVRGEQRSEVEIMAALAELILPPGRFDWSALRSHEALRRAISQTVAGYDGIHRPGRRRGEKREFTVAGRLAHGDTFPTSDGRARFHVVPVPDCTPDADELMLMTVRSEGQFNSVVYDEEDLYRGNRRRDVIMVSATEASRRGLSDGDSVLVTSATGELAAVVSTIDISDGSAAMYYPEANALVDRRLDPSSRTPAFKSVRVTIRRP